MTITFNQLHIGPDVIECLKKTGYMAPMHCNEYIALIDDLLKANAAGLSPNTYKDKWN